MKLTFTTIQELHSHIYIIAKMRMARTWEYSHSRIIQKNLLKLLYGYVQDNIIVV